MFHIYKAIFYCLKINSTIRYSDHIYIVHGYFRHHPSQYALHQNFKWRSAELRSRVVLWQDTKDSEVHAASIFWVVMLCIIVVGYQSYRGPCCLHLLGCDAVYYCGRIPKL